MKKWTGLNRDKKGTTRAERKRAREAGGPPSSLHPDQILAMLLQTQAHKPNKDDLASTGPNMKLVHRFLGKRDVYTEKEKKEIWDRMVSVVNALVDERTDPGLLRIFSTVYPEFLNVTLETMGNPGDYSTTLQTAVFFERTGNVKLLLEFEELDVNRLSKHDGVYITALGLAVEMGSLDIVEALLLREDLDVNSPTGCLPLSCAMDNGDIQAVKLLLKDPRVNVNLPNARGEAVLHIAAVSGNEEMAVILLKHPKIDVNIRMLPEEETDEASLTGSTPLHIASLEGHRGMVKLLLAHRDIKVNTINSCKGDTPLSLAIDSKNLDVIRLLLSHKDIDVNVQTGELRETPLHTAASRGNSQIVELLVSCKSIDVNLRAEPFRQTPLFLAVYAHNLNIIQLLLACKGIDINCEESSRGATPLWMAAADGRADIVQLLLDHKESDVDVNARTVIGIDQGGQAAGGKTPLCVASTNGHAKVVKLLLDSRFDVYLEVLDRWERTALQYAISQKHPDVARLLIEYKVKKSKLVQPSKSVTKKKVKSSKEKVQARIKKEVQRRQTEIEFKELETSLNALD